MYLHVNILYLLIKIHFGAEYQVYKFLTAKFDNKST
jgi:hypothetical protein